MTDRPLIFSARMVRALIAGRKTQTRRILKHGWAPEHRIVSLPDGPNKGLRVIPCEAGDRYWVREAWRTEDGGEWDGLPPNALLPVNGKPPFLLYEADAKWSLNKSVGRIRHAMHTPRWASRLTLEVADVRVQRLQDITEEDAEAEGCVVGPVSGNAWETAEDMRLGADPWWPSARDWYADLWDSINGKGAWAENPWVAALSFTVHHCNIDELKMEHTA